MTIGLIATDLDGTLLDAEGRVTDYTARVFRQVQQQGVRVVLATGRALPYFAEVRRALDTDAHPGNFYFAFNGGVIHPGDGSPEQIAPGLELPVVARLLALAHRLDLEALCYSGPDRWCYTRPGFARRRLDYLQSHGLPVEENVEHLMGQNRLLVSPACPPDMGPCAKVALLHSSRRLAQVLPQVQAVAGPDAKAMLVTPSWLEVVPAAVNKGVALGRILRQCGLDPARAAAFGDGENDLEMLAAVGHGYAMENAFPQVRAAAARLAPPNTADGVARTVAALCGL